MTQDSTSNPKQRRRGEGFWRRALTAQSHSGLSQIEFCRRNKLAVSTFQWWRRRLREDFEEPEEPEASFVEVFCPRESESERCPESFELIFRSGLRLKLPEQVEGRTLAEILWALEATSSC